MACLGSFTGQSFIGLKRRKVSIQTQTFFLSKHWSADGRKSDSDPQKDLMFLFSLYFRMQVLLSLNRMTLAAGTADTWKYVGSVSLMGSMHSLEKSNKYGPFGQAGSEPYSQSIFCVNICKERYQMA